MKTAVVTGITGQDGAYLAGLLLEQGYKVFGTSSYSGQSGVLKVKMAPDGRFESGSLAPVRLSGDGVPSPESPCIVPATTFVNGTAEVTLCIQGHKVWKEKKNGARTAQVHALINNTGLSQVCDLRVEVEAMEHAYRW